MLREISINNFRNVIAQQVPLSKINILIGPNNAGKSNFIKALNFIKFCFEDNVDLPGLQNAFNKNGWDGMLRREVTPPGYFHIDMTIFSVALLKYSVDFLINSAQNIPAGFYVNSESLDYALPATENTRPVNLFSCHNEQPGIGWFTYYERGTRRRKLKVSQHDLCLNQIGELLDYSFFRSTVYPIFKEKSEAVRNFFKYFSSYQFSDVSPNVLRGDTQFRLGEKYLDSNCTNFANVYAYLSEKYDFEDILASKLNMAMPGFKKLKTISLSEKYRELKISIDNNVYKFSELSDGTIKLSLLALILFTPEKYTVLSLDEPEINLHPAWIKLLARWILDGDSYQQLFLSTHSPDLLDGFTESFQQGLVGLYVFSQTGELQKKNPDELNAFFEQGWELGDLYRVGEPVLGGWPW